MVQEIDRCIGLNEHNSHSRYAPPALLATDRALLRDPCLGTPGSGNHFIELQVVDSVVDRHVAATRAENRRYCGDDPQWIARCWLLRRKTLDGSRPC